jgi:hypothetical protein
MIQDPAMLIVLAMSMLVGLGILCLALLKGWRGWLQLQGEQLALRRPEPASHSTARVEVSELRERVRRLEAIVNGTDP